MKIICGSITTTIVALTGCCLLNGCAHEKKETVYQPIESADSAPGTRIIGASTNLPVGYHWNATNGNATAPFTVQAVGGSNGALYYQWYFNVNTNDGGSQQINVETGTNAPLSYQWYKTTNTVEGTQH